MIYEFECEVCGKHRKVSRTNYAKPPKFCSNKCRGSTISSYLRRNFIWQDASLKERENHIREYYEKNVIKQDGCWDWKKAAKTEKYIRMNYARNEPRLSIHIYSYRIHKGEIPLGMCILHKCDNRRCSNPDHLFLGTIYDNIKDMISKSRHPHGESHGHAKLTEEQVRLIRDRINLGVSMNRLAKDFNVSKCTILKIKQNKRWKYVI